MKRQKASPPQSEVLTTLLVSHECPKCRAVKGPVDHDSGTGPPGAEATKPRAERGQGCERTQRGVSGAGTRGGGPTPTAALLTWASTPQAAVRPGVNTPSAHHSVCAVQLQSEPGLPSSSRYPYGSVGKMAEKVPPGPHSVCTHAGAGGPAVSLLPGILPVGRKTS